MGKENHQLRINMIDISDGVKLSLHLYISIHLYIQPITGLPLQLSIGLIVPLHLFSLIFQTIRQSKEEILVHVFVPPQVSLFTS